MLSVELDLAMLSLRSILDATWFTDENEDSALDGDNDGDDVDCVEPCCCLEEDNSPNSALALSLIDEVELCSCISLINCCSSSCTLNDNSC